MTYETFRALHVPGDPVVLYNAWDAGSARAVAESGARAIATGSWSVAAANGYDDGERLPLELALGTVERIAGAIDLPLTVDVERGFGDPAGTVARVAQLGGVGVNLEDGRPDGIAPLAEQVAALRAVKAANPAVFLNARHDAFLTNPAERHAELLDAALERGKAYAEAGADGYFVPGLADPRLIERVVAGVGLPVNVMASAPGRAGFAELGVARISYGPAPYLAAMAAVTAAAREVLA